MQSEPMEQKYFQNTNRINQLGYTNYNEVRDEGAPLKKFNQSFLSSLEREFDDGQRFKETTYNSFYNA
jgi:hypothetical protein